MYQQTILVSVVSVVCAAQQHCPDSPHRTKDLLHSGSDTEQQLLHHNGNIRAGKVPFNAHPFSHASTRTGRASLSPPRTTKVNVAVKDGTNRNSIAQGRRSLSPSRLKNTTVASANPNNSANLDIVTRYEMIRIISRRERQCVLPIST